VADSPSLEPNATDSSKEPEARWAEIVTGRYGLYTLSINIGIFMWAINNLVVAGVMPTVVADIGGMRLYSWTFALFSMGSVMGAASAGPLRDIFGGRVAYACAGTLFGLGLIGAALSPNMESLIATRFFQGLGGGAVSSLGYSMMATLYPERLRGRILAFTSTGWGVATSLGPGFGGIFAEFGLWREAFWGMTPLCLLFVVMALRIIPDARDGSRKPSFPFGRLLLIGSSVIALSASSQTDTMVLRFIFIALSIVLAAIAFIVDGRAARPMFPRKALRIFTETGALYWIMALNQGAVCIYATFQTLQLQVLHGVTPIVAAYLFMLSSLTWSLVAILVATWRGRMETVGIILGSIFLLIGTIGLAFTVVPGPVWLIAVFTAVCGAGIGFMNNMLIQRAIRSVPPEEKGIAGSSTQAIRTMGVAFGAAAAGLIAVMGGLSSTTPTVETVAPAMQWVYGMDVVVAAAGLIVAIGLVVATKK